MDCSIATTLERPLRFAWPLGHEEVARRLERQLEGEAMPHAQLFVGPRGVGKRLFARAFARHLLDPQGKGGISDLIELSPEGRLGLHPLAQIEEVRRQAQMTALSGSWKVYLIDDVERMSPAAANSLLKILEEPPPRTLFLLVSGRPQALLPTIVSRCHVVLFEPLPDDLLVRMLQERGEPEEVVRIVAPRSHGSMERALRLAHQRQDPIALLLLEWLPKLHQLRTAEVTGRLAALDPDRSKQEADPQELRLAFEEQCQLLLDWARDAQLLAQGITSHLCFPEHQHLILQQRALGLASLRAMEKAIYDAQLAVERMVKPSVLLTGLLLRLRIADAAWS